MSPAALTLPVTLRLIILDWDEECGQKDGDVSYKSLPPWVNVTLTAADLEAADDGDINFAIMDACGRQHGWSPIEWIVQPGLTPLQAYERARAAGWASFTDGGFEYSIDGSGPFVPDEFGAPIAVSSFDDETFWTTGEPGDPVTADDTWVLP